MKNGLRFEKLPLWRGAAESPERFDSLPFSLGWDKRGFIAQTTPEEIKKKIVDSYAAGDYSYGTKPPGSSKWSNRLGDAKCDFIKRTHGLFDRINVLEIGAGSLNIAERLTGQYDINRYLIFDPAMKGSSTRENIYVFSNYFQKEKVCNENIGLVLGFSVLEHVPDPVKLLADLHDILISSQGKAIFSFPDIEQQFKNGDFNSLLHEHLNYFTASTAAALFNRCGFNVLESESKDGTLWYYLEAKKTNSDPDVLSTDELLRRSAINFYRNIEFVSHSLSELQSQGKTVALHGACNGLNNILFLSGTKENENLLIFDGDRTKTGAYLPACSAPIRFSDDAVYKTADKVFIAALSYYSEVKQFLIEKHRIDPFRIQPIYRDSKGLQI